MKPLLLVTGDIVLDCHLYGGVKTAATSFSEPGTTYEQHLGGAVLTHRLLEAAADAAGRAWDQERDKWLAANAARKKKSLPPLPDDLPKDRPEPAFKVCLALDTADDLASTLPGHLRSYGVWSDQPAKKGSDRRVWRVERHFGYGPTESISTGSIFKSSSVSTSEPVLTVIDDGGILFRQESSRNVWPDFSPGDVTYFILKMSSPLCRGDLWAALAPVMDRLIVVVSAADLRREDTQIRHRLSWEECAESTLHALEKNSTVHDLLRAAHLIVNFRSAGALWIHRSVSQQLTVRLLFDHLRLEDDYDRAFEGTVYGFQTCFVTGIAHHLMKSHAESSFGLFTDFDTTYQALESGIAAGLTTHRRLLELGHGAVERGRWAKSGFPVGELGAVAAASPDRFISQEVVVKKPGLSECPWTLLAQAELAESSDNPLTDVAHLTALYGLGALSHVPALQLGRLFTVDRSEIESLRTLDALIRDYERVKVQKRPLCIGVFGPPGSGKSFAVKALAEAILGSKAPFLEFNLSQFKSLDELIGAFHRVRDAVLKGITPVAFWDEFDSQSYKWLQYLLAPMQDGGFQEGQITHPIGKCVFVFAGGTSDTLQQFGVAEPEPPQLTLQELAKLKHEARADRKLAEEAFREFKLLKGPDFISRLHGFLNVLGANPRPSTNCPDITWPIRRALILRSVRELKENEELDIDPGLLHALLSTPNYRHGARSLEKIVVALVNGREGGRLRRAALPSDPTLDRETNAAEFHRLMEHGYPDIEVLAAAVHQSFLSGAEEAALKAKIEQQPNVAWRVHPAVMTEYEQLGADFKASNRVAARRISKHLALIGFMVSPQKPNDDLLWIEPLKKAIEKHIERLAQAEHRGWCVERRANGWSYAEIRDNDLKHHPLLVDWSKLKPQEQEKNRNSARSIPALLQVAGFKALLAPPQ
ncbi:MAG TPA: RyR domain-containing protein [Thermoanaerobaculia bacterium]|nr:RyR domain-containing protein [Thermoanaerobaculia bacterium]